VDMEDFGHAQHEWLSQLLELPGRHPQPRHLWAGLCRA
jgi:hypothetical protein